ncbi:hypothetical protein OG558_06755 [Kribbella sp. NBC_01510]
MNELGRIIDLLPRRVQAAAWLIVRDVADKLGDRSLDTINGVGPDS